MCGLVGMVSWGDDVVPDVLARLAMVEYRGYDSFGIAGVFGGVIEASKGVGSISQAIGEGRLGAVPAGGCALGHTRWATHGRVTVSNAHPHLSFDGKVAVAHNGIIENHLALRRALESRRVRFAGETDSEVVAHLVAAHLADGVSLLTAISLTVSALRGEYALGIISTAEPSAIYGVRWKSPLVVCCDGRRAALASDQAALAGAGDGRAVFLDDGDIVRLRPDAIEIFALGESGTPRPVSRGSVPAMRSDVTADRDGHAHFMLKEIHETPAAVRSALRIPAPRFGEILPPGRHVTLFGAGSGFYLALIGQYLLTRLAGVAATALFSGEAEYFATLRPGDCAVAISQSGETFDTLEMCRVARHSGAVLTSISNVPNSTQERLAVHRLRQACGPEISVLSTKSIVSQAVILGRLALETGLRDATLGAGRYTACMESITRLPETLEDFIEGAGKSISDLAYKYKDIQHLFFVGRGALYPVALESALKYKEATYAHAEGMSAGFFKHGTISLIAPGFLTVALIPSPRADRRLFTAILANVSEVAARGGRIVGFGPGDIDDADLLHFADYHPLPYHDEDVSDLVLQLVAGELFAYFCALHLGREIDRPRNLAKCVTVR